MGDVNWANIKGGVYESELNPLVLLKTLHANQSIFASLFQESNAIQSSQTISSSQPFIVNQDL